MASTERLKGILVHRPIIYGSQARLLTEEEKATAPPGHTHRWTIFFTSATSPPPETPLSALSSTNPPPIDMNYLPGGADDLTYLIKRVTFRLHDTYTNPNRVCDRPPYQVTETGWGEFIVQIKINFIPEAGEKPLSLAHGIKLHHWGAPIEASVPSTPSAAALTAPVGEGGTSAAAPTADATAASTPAPDSTAPPTDEAKPDVAKDGEVIKVDDGESQMEKKEESAVEGADGAVSGPAEASSSTTGTDNPAGPVSIASTLPVHAWQYDEMIFSDPPTAFLNILNENPPTPLPSRNRRPRDQREDSELRGGAKGKKAKPATAVGFDPRTRSADPKSHTPAPVGTPARDGSVAATAATATPAPTGPVGIPGEPGSADVPLEFSQEMEKSEWNRLNDVRIAIVEQMDKWRERLIRREKELSKLKEEMSA